MKYRIFLLLAVLFANTVSFAYDDPAKDSTQNAVTKQLLKTIEEHENTLKAKDTELKKLTADIEKLKKNLKSARDSINQFKKDSKILKEQKNAELVRSLTRYVEQLKKDSTRLVLEKAAEYDRGRQDALALLKKAEAQHAADSTALAQLKQKSDEQAADLAKYARFKSIYLLQLADGVDDQWLKQTYENIDLAKLQKACNEYRDYKDENPKLGAAYNKLTALYKEVSAYKEGCALVAAGAMYDKAKVQSTLTKLRSFQGKTANQANAQALSKLVWKLDNYAETIQCMQEVVKAIEKHADGMEGPALKSMIDAEKKKGSKDNIEATYEIDMTKDLMARYFKELGDIKVLNKAKMLSGKVRNEIMKIQP